MKNQLRTRLEQFSAYLDVLNKNTEIARLSMKYMLVEWHEIEKLLKKSLLEDLKENGL